MSEFTLILGNKAYSSWSLRASPDLVAWTEAAQAEPRVIETFTT